ncbi:MAG: hypothetical protein WC284_08495 [Candidimonas sp.]
MIDLIDVETEIDNAVMESIKNFQEDLNLLGISHYTITEIPIFKENDDLIYTSQFNLTIKDENDIEKLEHPIVKKLFSTDYSDNVPLLFPQQQYKNTWFDDLLVFFGIDERTIKVHKETTLTKIISKYTKSSIIDVQEMIDLIKEKFDGYENDILPVAIRLFKENKLDLVKNITPMDIAALRCIKKPNLTKNITNRILCDGIVFDC